MVTRDTVADALSVMMNAESVGKKECYVRPCSKVLLEVMRVIKDEGYIGEFETIKDGKGGIVKVSLLGKINKCQAIKPNFFVKASKFENVEKRYLPAKDFGIMIVSTDQGILSHKEAKKKNLGGKMLAFIY